MYYIAKVSIKVETEGGSIKKSSESYLVDAISPTDVEAKITEIFKEFTQDWELVSVTQSKIVSVIA